MKYFAHVFAFAYLVGTHHLVIVYDGLGISLVFDNHTVINGYKMIVKPMCPCNDVTTIHTSVRHHWSTDISAWREIYR